MANGLGEATLSSGFNKAPDLNFRSAPATREKIPQTNLGMEGRATPLKDNPAEVQEEEGLRKAIKSKDDDVMTKRLLAAAGIKAPDSQVITKDIPKDAKKPQGFWAKIKEAIENFFRKFFR